MAVASVAVGSSAAVAKPPPDKGPTATIDVALSAPESVGKGEQLEYLATVKAGKSPLDDVRVTDALPSSVRYVSATSDQGTCSETSGTVSCTLGRLERRETRSVRILVLAETPATVTNLVDVSASSDGSAVTGQASATTTITAPPPPDGSSLRVVYARDAGPAMVGAPLTYRAQITNDGEPIAFTATFGASDNWTLGHPVVESFTASQGTCSGAPAARPDAFGFPINQPLARVPTCDVGVLGTGQTIELIGVVRTNHPTTERVPLYTGMSAILSESSTWLALGSDQTVVTTGSSVTDCWFTGTGTFTNVPAYVDCATAS